MSTEDAWLKLAKKVAGIMRLSGAREFRLVDSGGKFHFEVTPDEQKSDFAKLSELNAELVAALENVVSLYDDFESGDSNYENAYLCFYKGESARWEKARAAIAKTKEDCK